MAAATILDFRNREFFICWRYLECIDALLYQILSIRSFLCGDIVIFQIFKMADAAILDFWNRKILLGIGIQRVESHQCAKFRQNRSIGCEDTKIFLFFQMAAAAMLDFRNRELLFAVGIWRAQLHHCTKFSQNWSFLCGDIAIFRIIKMAAAAILDFWNREILLAIGVQGGEAHQRAKFCQNRSIGCEDIKIFPFFKDGDRRHLGFSKSWIFICCCYLEVPVASLHEISSKSVVPLRRYCNFSNFTRWRLSAILDLFGAYLDHQQWVFGGLYQSAKFGYDWCSSFYNMNISIFVPIGWKMPIHAPKIAVLGNLIT